MIWQTGQYLWCHWIINSVSGKIQILNFSVVFQINKKKRCICSLHKEYLKANNGKKVLEISSKSEDKLGVDLSAFNLMFKTKSGKEVSVESAFQAGKVFENGGPYTDLLDVSSKAAKKDERLKSSGRIISFCFDGIEFETEPKTYFYNWLYIKCIAFA